MEDLTINNSFEGVEISFHKEGIIHIIFKDEISIDLPLILKLKDFTDQYSSDQTYINIFEFKDFTDVDQEVLQWASSNNNNSKSIVDILVYSHLPQKLVADFYTKIMNPITPTKIFKTIEEAKDYALSELSKLH